MATQKVCKHCKALYEGQQCPQCGSDDTVENFKGKVIILKPEESEIAKNTKIAKKGAYAIKALGRIGAREALYSYY